MEKDSRTQTVKILIEGGHLSQFREIFKTIPKTVVAKQNGFLYQRLSQAINKVGNLKIDDVFALSIYFDIQPEDLFKLIGNQYNHSKGKPGRKPKG